MISTSSITITLLSLTTTVLAYLATENLSPLPNLGPGQKATLDLSTTTNTAESSPICSPGFHANSDTVIYTTPYPYTSVMPIISDFANLDYAAIPPQNIRLNSSSSDNMVGTARFYNNPTPPGAMVVETLVLYSKPLTGPFHQVLSSDPLTITTLSSPVTSSWDDKLSSSSSNSNNKETNITIYTPHSSITATPICHGLATQLNYTTHFCSTDPILGRQLTHRNHLSMGEGTNRLLGNRSFVDCMSLQAEGGNGSLGYPRWGRGLFMGVGNSPGGEGAGWSACFGLILVCSTLVVLGGGVFNY